MRYFLSNYLQHQIKVDLQQLFYIMNRTNKDIKDNFSLFQTLLFSNKIIEDSKILLEPKRSNARWLEGKTNTSIPSNSNCIKLLLEQNKTISKYGIKLRCLNLSKEPFFRFDSDGPAHRNDTKGTKLEDQVVTTPHFNSYAENGKPIAYKNDKLKDEAYVNMLVNDINLGLALFCKEVNAKLSSGGIPVTEEMIQLKIPLVFNKNDIDQLNFD